MESQLEKAHRLNHILLDKLDDVCRKYHITYFLDSGSLIGAVRHKSFIPWDDDVDIAFHREEYNKLLNVPKEEWGDDFCLIGASEITPGGFHDFMPHLVYLKEEIPLKSYSKTREKCDKRYLDRMIMDIILIDNAYDSAFMQKILNYRLILLYGQAMGYRDYIDYSSYGLIQKIIIYICSHIGRMRKLWKIYRDYDRVSQSVKKKYSYVYQCNCTIPYLHNRYERAWFERVVSLLIDEKEYDAPAGYHEILTKMYGNYMQLPPEDKRVPVHIANWENNNEKSR